MKLYKSLFIVAAITCGMMTSCSEDGYWDKATPAALGLTDGTSYAFDSKSLSYVYYPADALNGTDINITITRGDASKDFTLPIKAVFSDSTLISGPESVTFTAGQNTAVYPIHFIREIEIGEAVTAKLAIDTVSVGIPRVEMPAALDSLATAADSAKYKADSTAYEIYQAKLANYKLATTVSISKDYNWESLGKGKWSDDFYFEVGGIDVEVKQAVENPSMFRVMLDYAAVAEEAGASANGNQSAYTNITLLKKGDELMGAAITEDNLVYWTKINLGYASGGIDLIAMHPMDFSANWARYNNTSYVAEYQSNGLPAKIVLSGLILKEGTSSGWAPCQTNDPIATLVFPGVKIYDYSAEVSYVGMFTDPDGAISVWGDLTLGSDAKTAKAVVMSQDADPAAVADAIAAGELEAADVKAGRIELPLPEDANGLLQIVVAVIDEGEAKNVATAKFEYYSGKNPWTSLGKGLYTDDLVYPLYTKGNPSTTYEVEIQEHSEISGLYRLVDPYGPAFPYYEAAAAYTSTVIEVHAEDPDAVYVPEQSTGLTLSSSDGEMSILSAGAEYYAFYGDDYYDLLKKLGYFGTLKDGVITFPSIEVTDEETDEVKYTYQGLVIFADDEDSSYAMGRNGEWKIVLPSAVDATARMAARFATNLNKYNVDAKRSLQKGGRQAKTNKQFKRFAKNEMLKKRILEFAK